MGRERDHGRQARAARAGRPAGGPGASGFTLVEALIVLTLIGAAVGISIEGFREYREVQRAKAGATQLVTVLNLAKSRAMAMNRVVVIDFAPGGLSPAQGFYQVFLDQDDDRTLDPGEDVAANLTDATERAGMVGYQLPAKMAFTSPGMGAGPLGLPTAADGVTFTGDAVSFMPDGTASETGHVTFSDPDGRTYAVTVTAGGAVRMYRSNGKGWQ